MTSKIEHFLVVSVAPSQATIQFKLNGRPVSVQVDPERSLLWVLRTELHLTGTKYGCGEGYCGACTVLVNDKAVLACQVSIAEVQGKGVTTIEGLAQGESLHPLQKSFVRHDAIQCGYCTPGMVMQAVDLLKENPHPSRDEIVAAMDGHFCRCGSHERIIQAIKAAAAEMAQGGGHD
jgi:aerobic-type carbon monoxide dehydrogenase small subunit (CoxS/CutS family)